MSRPGRRRGAGDAVYISLSSAVVCRYIMTDTREQLHAVNNRYKRCGRNEERSRRYGNTMRRNNVQWRQQLTTVAAVSRDAAGSLSVSQPIGLVLML